MTWKLVPVEPTQAMMLAGGDTKPTTEWAEGRDDAAAVAVYRAMLAASPDPTTNEALVERVARAIAGSVFDERDRQMWRSLALVAIRAMGEKPSP